MSSRSRYETRKATIADAISIGIGELQSLAEEMRTWEENMQEKFSSTSKYDAVNEAADTLEQCVDEPDVPEWISKLEVEYSEEQQRGKRGLSRASRRDNAVSALRAACEFLREKESELTDTAQARLTPEIKEEQPESRAVQEQADECSALADELENICDNAEGVDFPGMFG